MSDPSAQPPVPPAPARRRWLWAALFVSLGLNLAIAGFVGGAVLHGKRDGAGRAGPDIARDLGLGPYFRALEPDQRRAIGRDLWRQRQAADAGAVSAREAMRAGFGDALDLLRADPFDAAQLATVLSAQAEAAESRRRRGQAALVAHIAGLSVEERRAYADRLAETLRKPRARRAGKPDQRD